MKKLFILILLIPGMVFSMQQDPLGIEIELIFTQKTPKTFNLKTTITDEENSEPVQGLTLTYSAKVNDESITLGTAVTNRSGIAELKSANLDALRKFGHNFSFTVSFAGNTNFLENETTLEIKDAALTVSTEIVDSVNMVYARLSRWNEAGEVVPVEDAEVKIYVPRLFSLLPVTDLSTDEEGVGEVKFPYDIPGGMNGELTIVSRLEDSEEFGIIESSIPTTWGIKAITQETKLPRALWSPNAPLWMVITFAILMTGVWFHYGLIIFYMFRIRKFGKEQGELDFSE